MMETAPIAVNAARGRTGPLLFVPGRLQRAAFLKWLKRVHAWTGLWGALLFLGLGVSGFLLNHRTILKIETGVAETSSLDVAVARGAVTDAASLDRCVNATLGLPGEGRPPPVEPKATRPAIMGGCCPGPSLSRAYFSSPTDA